MSVNDDLQDKTIERVLDLHATGAHLSREAINRLIAVQDDINAKILRTNLTSNARQRLQSLLDSIRDLLKSYAGAERLRLTEALHDIGVGVAAVTVKDIYTTVGANLGLPTLTSQMVNAIIRDANIINGGGLKDFWSRMPQQMIEAYTGAIKTGLLRGDSSRDIVKEILDSPIINARRNEVTTWVRTSVASINNEVRAQTYQVGSRVVKGIQWVSTLDSRTSKICISLDGLLWDLEYNPIGHTKKYPGHIAHPRCRSTQVPFLKSWKELGGTEARKVPEGTRSSMDGQVPESLTYDKFLIKKGDKFAKDVLGDARFNLWKQGKISTYELTDNNARTLSVKELLDKYAK